MHPIFASRIAQKDALAGDFKQFSWEGLADDMLAVAAHYGRAARQTPFVAGARTTRRIGVS